MSTTPSPALASLIAIIQAEFEASSEDIALRALDYDDPKWDEYPFDLFEQACMALGLA